MSDDLQKEMDAYRALRDSEAFGEVVALENAFANEIGFRSTVKGYNADQYVSSVYELTQKRTIAVMQCMHSYLSRDAGLPQNAQKFEHSIEVGEGTPQAFKALVERVGRFMPDQRFNHMRLRGYGHDEGVITNLADKVLNAKIPDKDYSPREAAIDAAQKIVEERPDLGTIEEVRDAILFAAISDRKGALFNKAKDLDSRVADVRSHFKRPDVHNPVHVQGLDHFTAHHDSPDGTKNYSGIAPEDKGALDHLAVIVDISSACTGDALSLDEIAICMVKYAEDGKFDKEYARFWLEGYGTGNSQIEQWYDNAVKDNYCRVPGGAVRADAQEFAKECRSAVANGGDIQTSKVFPQAIGPWAPFDKQDLVNLADKVDELGSVAGVVAERVKGLPILKTGRILKDISVTHTEAGPHQFKHNYTQRLRNFFSMEPVAVTPVHVSRPEERSRNRLNFS